jgi:hypothetical protein
MICWRRNRENRIPVDSLSLSNRRLTKARNIRRHNPFNFIRSSPDQRQANAGGTVPVLIEGVVPFPPVFGLRSKGALERLCTREYFSTREISRLTDARRSGVLKALEWFSIARNEDRSARIGHLPFAYDYLNHRLLKNDAEQVSIRMMREYRADKVSLREIAWNLTLKLTPTKLYGVWQANMVREIHARA